MSDTISTPVDELMNLIKANEKISFKDAAKKLNVPPKSIQEWAKVLEEESLIKIAYSFATPYMINQAISDGDKKARIKKFDQRKDNLGVKLDMTAKFFSDLSSEIESVEKVVQEIHENMESKLSEIGTELNELAQAEAEKEKIDKQIIKSKQESERQISQLENHIKRTEDDFDAKLNLIQSAYEKDVQVLKKNKTFVARMKEEKKKLAEKLAECNALSQKIQSDIEKQDKEVNEADRHIDSLQKERVKLLSTIQKEHNKLDNVISQSKDYEKEIRVKQKELYDKIMQKSKELGEKEADAKKLPKSIKDLLQRKNKIQDIILDLHHAESEAKNDIIKLKRESLLLQKHVGMKDVDGELRKIHADIVKMEKQKSFLKKKLKELYSILKTK